MRGPRNLGMVSVGFALGASIAPAMASGDVAPQSLAANLLSTTALSTAQFDAKISTAAVGQGRDNRTVIAGLGESIDLAPKYTRFGFDEDGRAVVEGQAAPFAIVYVQLDGITVKTVVANDVGRWAATLQARLTAGAYRIGVLSRRAGATQAKFGDDLRIVIPSGYRARAVTLIRCVIGRSVTSAIAFGMKAASDGGASMTTTPCSCTMNIDW